MYGPGYFARFISGKGVDDYLAAYELWMKERAPKVQGYVDTRMVLGDDGRSIIVIGRFESKQDYAELGRDTEQQAFWALHMAPLFDGEPTWVDGEVRTWSRHN